MVDQPRPHRVVVIACTAAKLSSSASARRIYTGVTWSTWRRHGPPDGSMPIGWSLWALSAEHGLVRSWEEIAPYDRKLTKARLRQLVPVVRSQWERFVPKMGEAWSGHRPTEAEVVVIGGDAYQDLAACGGLPVVARIHGRPKGIGLLRKRLATWASEVRRHMNSTPHADGAWPPSANYAELVEAKGL